MRSGNQKQDNGTPHGERLRGAISNQSARGLTNPSIVPPQPPAAHQHIRPHCPPPSCSGICSPQQPVLSEAVRAEVSHWQFAPNRFVRASNRTTPTCGFLGLGSGSGFLWRGELFHTEALGCERTCRTAEVEELVECPWIDGVNSARRRSLEPSCCQFILYTHPAAYVVGHLQFWHSDYKGRMLVFVTKSINNLIHWVKCVLNTCIT